MSNKHPPLTPNAEKAPSPTAAAQGENDQWAPLDYPGGLIEEQWQRSTWRGLEKLACAQCHWDTLNGIEAAREHAQICPRCHPKRSADLPSPILVADKRGNIKEA